MHRLLFLLALSASVTVACTDDDLTPTDGTDTDEGGDTDVGDTDVGDTDDGSAGDVEAGARVFAATCAGCHGADGSGVTGPDLDQRAPSLSQAQVETVVLQGQGYMPAQDVTEQEATDVAAYVIDTHGG